MADDTQSTVNLRHYIDVLWRRKWIVIETLIIIPAIVLAVTMTRPTEYTASARVMAVSQSPAVGIATSTNVDTARPDVRELQTLATFVVTPEIAQRVRDRLGWRDRPATLMSGTSAEADPNADIIEVTATRARPEQAADLANAFAEEFVTWRKREQQRSLDSAIKLVDTQLEAGGLGAAEQAALVDRRSQLDVLRALVNGGVAVGQTAQVPASPSSPKPLRDGALAVAAALVVGIGLAFVREALDVQLHSAEEVAALTDVPVIGAVPEFHHNGRRAASLVTLDDPGGPGAEAYRFLRTNLDFINFKRDIRTVLVTSPLPGQGKSTTLANLAVSLLRAGKKVAVVEADLRRPSLHRVFKAGDGAGLTTVLSGATPLAHAVQRIRFRDATVYAARSRDRKTVRAPAVDAPTLVEDAAPGTDLRLTLLPSGPLPPNPGELVGSSQLAEVLDELRAQHDYVLVDAPPMFAVGDAAAMAALVDGIIVVMRLDETRAETVKGVEDFLSRVPARPLGVVVTGVPRSARSRDLRYYDYYERAA